MKESQSFSLGQLEDQGLVQLGRGKVISKNDLAGSPGPYPVYSSAKENNGEFGRYGLYAFDEELITWSVDGGGGLFHRPAHRFSITNVGGFLRILKPERLTYRFLFHALTLRHSEIPFDWVLKAHPSVIRKLYRDIPIPSLHEQKRIVHVLDKAFEAIAVAKANAENNLQNARALFGGELHSVFTRVRSAYPKKNLADLCQSGRVITYGVIKLGDDIPNGTPCLRTSNVRWLRIDTGEMKRISPELSAEYSRTVLLGGEVLVNVRGTLGGVAVVAPEMKGWNVSREVAVVPGDQSKVHPDYLSYLIGSAESQKWLGEVKKGATYVGINIEDLRLLPIPLPPLPEQVRIAQALQTFEGNARQLEQLYLRKIVALDELKKSLLRQAFTGKL